MKGELLRNESMQDKPVRDEREIQASLGRMLLALMPDWQIHELGPFEYLSGGYSNRNFRVRRNTEAFVLRLPTRDRPYVDRGHEVSFYRSNHRARVPELVAFDRVTGNMLTRFESGPLLSEAEVAHDLLIDYLSSLHSALPSSGRSYDPMALAREYLLVGDPPGWIRHLAEHSIWSPPVTAPCHNDLNPWNVILKASGRWVTLDWEWFGDNDPLFDLVTLHQGLALGDDLLPAMAERRVAGKADDQRLNACLLAYWLREYAWAHAELSLGNVRDEIQMQLATAASRLERF